MEISIRWRFLKFYNMVGFGDGFNDKLAILCSRMISFFYHRVSRRRDFTKLNDLLRVLLKNRVLNVDGVKYSLVDYESLFLVLPEIENKIWDYFRPARGEVFIDVGAHIGKYALRVARKVGNKGLVIAIEPNPDNYQALLRGVKLNNLSNIVPLNLAAWSDDGEIRIFSGDSSGHHSAIKDYGFGSFSSSCLKIDSLINELNIKRVDWIKIDVEGAELEVLKGLIETLNKKRPKLIVEIWFKNYDDIESMLKKHNYKINRISGGEPSYFYCEPICSI